MAILLTPRIYGQSMKWQISPKNKIDTVTANPILNTIAESSSQFYEESVPVIIDGQTQQATLPIGPDVQPTIFRTMRNRYNTLSIAGTETFAKARTEVVKAHGETTIKLATPVDGLPSVSIAFKGKTSICERGELILENFPNWDDMNRIDFSMASWIEERATTRRDGLTWVYQNGTYSTNPWVRRVTTDKKDVQPSDMWTQWGEWVRTRRSAEFNKWSNNSNYTFSSPNSLTIYQYPNQPEGDYIYIGRMDNFYDDTQTYNITINKIDNYTYKLIYNVPIRFAYIAGSQTVNQLTINRVPLDSYAFVDYMTEIDAVFIGKPYNTDDVTVQLSLDDNGHLITNTKNVNVLKIDKSEFITMNSTMTPEGLQWTDEMLRTILVKYAKGKYIITCEVPASWAIQNDIHPESELQIAQQNGQLISRQNTPCTFKVKTITKAFRNNAFTFALGLMEV